MVSAAGGDSKREGKEETEQASAPKRRFSALKAIATFFTSGISKSFLHFGSKLFSSEQKAKKSLTNKM